MAKLSSTLHSNTPLPSDAAPADAGPTLSVLLPDGRRWPCALRRSARARRCRLRVDGRGVATLVVPQKSRQTLPALQHMLNGFTPWLEKTLSRLLGPEAEPPAVDGGIVPTPPDLADIPASISLPLSGMVWHIYVVDAATPAHSGRVTLHEEAYVDAGGGRIELRGATQHPNFAATCCLLLQRWLRGQAARWLPPHLRLLASRMGAEVGRITVRSQRGRWGSCSSRGDISLNCLLLLLPLPLLDHVCLHELCHLRHMDHSRRYRAHLALHAPHWQWNEKALNTAWRQMPLWAVWRGA